jgi:hypothetical protein
MKGKFKPGDRVLISPNFFWAKCAMGTISHPPPEVITLSGPWDENLTHQEHSALGEATVYWVWLRRTATGRGRRRALSRRMHLGNCNDEGGLA